MKFGIRKPSLKKSLKARTTGRLKRSAKSAINPLYGKKGMGWINNPEKALYNKVYNQTTRQAIKLNSSSKSKKIKNDPIDPVDVPQTSQEDTKNGCLGCGGCLGFFFLFGFLGSFIDHFIVLPLLGEQYSFVTSITAFILTVFIFYLVYSLFSQNTALEHSEKPDTSFNETETTTYDDELIYQQTESENELMPETQDNLQLFNQSIPQDVFDLLWFLDGPYQNFYQDNYEVHDLGYFTMNIRMAPDEPSGISTKAPIESQINFENIGYFPSYKDLSPSQKYTYLTWLKDVSQPIDIGYVFIFYYGLERHIISGKTEKAVEMIYKLKQYHHNNSFQNYSNNAIILASMFNRNPKWIAYINPEHLNPSATALIKAVSLRSFSVDDILLFRKSTGYTNDRYIKLHPEILKANILSILQERYFQDVYPLPIETLSTIPQKFVLQFANYSLSPEHKNLSLPDILSSGIIKNDLLSILTTAHEKTKIGLRESRKSKKSISD